MLFSSSRNLRWSRQNRRQEERGTADPPEHRVLRANSSGVAPGRDEVCDVPQEVVEPHSHRDFNGVSSRLALARPLFFQNLARPLPLILQTLSLGLHHSLSRLELLVEHLLRLLLLGIPPFEAAPLLLAQLVRRRLFLLPSPRPCRARVPVACIPGVQLFLLPIPEVLLGMAVVSARARSSLLCGLVSPRTVVEAQCMGGSPYGPASRDIRPWHR